VALVLAARPPGDPEVVTLKGRTSKGHAAVLDFVNGELMRARVKASVRCPKPTLWESIVWRPEIGIQGEFHQDGPIFRVRHFYEVEAGRGTLVMIGELADDQDSARGRIDATWVSPDRTCVGGVRFRAG
jgi:hypothetical protein